MFFGYKCSDAVTVPQKFSLILGLPWIWFRVFRTFLRLWIIRHYLAVRAVATKPLSTLTLVACVPERCAFSSTTLSARFSATLPTRSHSACRWSHFTTSTAVIIFICPASSGNATYHNNWWPSACRRWASCLEYPTRFHRRLFVVAHFQTISQDLSVQSIILSTKYHHILWECKAP